MAFAERKALYEQIEAKRKKPLIAYVTSSRHNASAQMGGDVIPEYSKQILRLPNDLKSVDLLIVSNGGDPTVAWRVICMLREKVEHISVLLPNAAFSAATLLALGANEIIMHPFANLGPVDPQLVSVKKSSGAGGQPEVSSFGSEDLRNYLEFVKKDVGISDQEQLEKAFELVGKEIGTIQIGAARRSSYLALSMGEKLLELHMKDDKSKAKAIAETLNKSFYYHGYPVGRKEAKEIGLPIVDADEALETLLWQVWEDIENEMQCNKPFNPLEVVFSSPAMAAILAPVPQVQIPPNLDPQMLQMAIAQIMQQIKIVQVPPIDYELFMATLESARCRSEFRVKLKINAVRQPDLNIAVSVANVAQQWTFSVA